MRVAIVFFLKSPQTDLIAEALRQSEIEPILYQWSEGVFPAADGFVLLGGMDQDEQSVLARELKAQNALGKPVLSFGEGAKCLVESGILPGLEGNEPAIRLHLHSERNAQAELVRLSDHYQRNAFTSCLAPKRLLPVSNTEEAWCFAIPPALLHEMTIQGLNVFEYCNAAGEVTGGVTSIAGLSNKAGNVLALLPPVANREDLDKIFYSMRMYMANPYQQQLATETRPLDYYPR
jgi:phosphoribosylformylglycinamidine synthase subunit PurQ / glutaminase